MLNDKQLRTLLEVAKKAQKKAPGPWFTDIDDAEECGPHSHSGLSKVESGSSGADWTVARLCETTEANHIAAFDPSTCVKLVREVIRLRAGDFTPEEFQNLCHNKSVQDGFEAFADGCEAYQQKMFGRCRTRGQLL